MEDNRDLVGRKLDIQFDPVSGIYCSLKGGKGVFRNLMVIIMQSPVGKKCATSFCFAASGSCLRGGFWGASETYTAQRGR